MELFIQYVTTILSFLQGIAWPIVAYLVFRCFAPPIKEIITSLKDVVHDRGIKLSSTALGVEIPGTQEPENIQEFINTASPLKYMANPTTPNKAESINSPLKDAPQNPKEVFETHERRLINDIYPAINNFLEKHKDSTSKEELLLGLLCDAYINLYFERSYQRILNSQLTLLFTFKQRGTDNLRTDEAKNIIQLQNTNQPISSFDKWLDFLIKARFIEVNDESITITNEGKEFIDYISARGYKTEK
jgi:hypothetical protein